MKNRQSYTGHRKRLKQRFQEKGLDALLDHEVLELLLTFSIPRKDTKPIAWELLKRHGSISSVLDSTPEELHYTKGIGGETAVFISFLRALIKRYFLEEVKDKDILKCPEDVIRFSRASLEGEKDEIFEVIYLTSKNAVIRAERIAVGTISHASVPPRKVIENAIKSRAAGMIFVHNHPSGDPQPSREDMELTDELAKAACAIGINVHDHIIVGKSKYFSFRENNLMKYGGRKA